MDFGWNVMHGKLWVYWTLPDHGKIYFDFKNDSKNDKTNMLVAHHSTVLYGKIRYHVFCYRYVMGFSSTLCCINRSRHFLSLVFLVFVRSQSSDLRQNPFCCSTIKSHTTMASLGPHSCLLFTFCGPLQFSVVFPRVETLIPSQLQLVWSR